MNELLQEFWEAWKAYQRTCRDLMLYDDGKSNRSDKSRTRWNLERIATRIEAAERAAIVAQATTSDDVPGQMYFEDISTPMPVAAAAKGAA